MPKSDDIIQKVKAKAHANNKHSRGCAQSVLGALQQELGIGDKESFKAATVHSWWLSPGRDLWGAYRWAHGLRVGHRS